MAIAQINPSGAIVYGGAAITPPSTPSPGSVMFYTDPSRDIYIPNASTLGFYQEINGRYLADEWVLEGGILAASGDTAAASGVNMDAVVYYAPPGLTRHHTLTGLAWGYDGTPGSGILTIESPSGNPIFGPLPVTTSGTSYDNYASGLKAPANTELLVRLKANSGVHSYVSVKGHRVE
jgi:hypothetical protein